MKKFTIICSDEKSAPLGSYLIANKIEFECKNIIENDALEIMKVTDEPSN